MLADRLVLPETLGCSMVGPHVGTLAQCPYTRAGLLLPTHADWRRAVRVISKEGESEFGYLNCNILI
jgi:hypothetical protein